jgi:hypothetical protein
MPRAIRLGDVNGDGNLDIVCTYWDAVAILLGNGDGTFRDGPRYQLARGVGTHAMADVNRDGKLDLIVPCAAIDSVAVLLGNGDGTFQVPRYVRTIPGPGWVEAADFNGDGIPDLAVASDSESTVTGITHAVDVLLGAGDGSFPSSRRIDVPAGAFTLAVGDIDGDGHTDIVAETSFTSILWGSGTGSFQLYQVPHDVPAGYPPLLADVDGDGRSDIITITNGAVTVRFNAGGRSFRPLVVFQSGSAHDGIVGDFNSDGKPDFVSLEGSSVVVRLYERSEFRVYPSTDQTPVSYGEPVTVRWQLVATEPVLTPPSGVLTWTVGGATMGTSKIAPVAPSSDTWEASFSAVLPPGVYNVVGQYAGDSLVPGPVGFRVQVDRGTSSTSAAVTTASPVFDQPILVTARVSAGLAAPLRPTGGVVFQEGDRVLASAVIDSGGQAAAVISGLSGGTHLIQTSYSGDSTFLPSSQTLTLALRPAPSSISLACLPNPAGDGEIVRCAVRATDSRATGAVALRDGTSVVSSAPLTAGRRSWRR